MRAAIVIWTVLIVVQTILLAGCQSNNKAESSTVVLDTLGLTIRQVSVPREKGTPCIGYKALYNGREFDLAGNYCFRELSSTTVKYGCTFKEEPCYIDGTYLILTYGEHCCYNLVVYDMSSIPFKQVHEVGGNHAFAFVDKDTRTMIYHNNRWVNDDSPFGITYLDFFSSTFNGKGWSDTLTIKRDLRLNKADFVSPDSTVYEVLQAFGLGC